MLNKKDLNF